MVMIRLSKHSNHGGGQRSGAIEEAEGWAQKHAGVLVWRYNDPLVGDEGEPEVVFTVGRVGDFD
jgi:hypothetical protein